MSSFFIVPFIVDLFCLIRKSTLKMLIESQLKLLHPFMPFVTEVIWSEFLGKEKLLMVETWPEYH